MENNFKPSVSPDIDLKSLKRIIFMAGEISRSRTSAFALAKAWRHDCPLAFVRVLKVDDAYFIITDEDDYNYYWELRKIAMRNERRIINEVV